MHHFKAKGGTHFNFNSDMSGDVRLHREPDDAVGAIRGADLLEFARWYAAEYGEASSDPESLTARVQLLERQMATVQDNHRDLLSALASR